MPLLPFGPDGVRGRTSLGTWDDRNIRRGGRRDNNRHPRQAAERSGLFVHRDLGHDHVFVSFFTSNFGVTVVMVSFDVSTTGILTVSVSVVTRGVCTTTSPSEFFLHPASTPAARASTTSAFFTAEAPFGYGPILSNSRASFGRALWRESRVPANGWYTNQTNENQSNPTRRNVLSPSRFDWFYWSDSCTAVEQLLYP